MLKGMSIEELKNSIWKCKNGMVALGGFSVEAYEDELERMTGTRRGYHETEVQIKEYLLGSNIDGEIELIEIENDRYVLMLNGKRYGLFDVNLNVIVDK